MKRTKEEIDAEVLKLQTMKPTVRRGSMFGDDHHAAIDAQVRVAEEDMSSDDIFYEYTHDHERNSALAMRDWMDGDSEDTPSEEWESLVE